MVPKLIPVLGSQPAGDRSRKPGVIGCRYFRQARGCLTRCASGCVVECRICNREVAGSNLSLSYFAPRSTQPSIPPGSVNEYYLRLGRQRQVWLIPIVDERVGVQVKTVKSLENTCHTWALLRWWFTTKRRYIKCMQLYLYLCSQNFWDQPTYAYMVWHRWTIFCSAGKLGEW